MIERKTKGNRSKVIEPRMSNKPVNTIALEKWYQRWLDSIGDLENVWLTRSTYLAGDHLTIADLLGNDHLST